jgi:hypothetical protein
VPSAICRDPFDVSVSIYNSGPDVASGVVAGLLLPPGAEFTPDAGYD